jgi:hypothetical protein
VSAGLVDGTVIQWIASAEATAAGVFESAEASAAAIVRAAPRLDVALFESADPAEAGAALTYSASFGHRATSSLAPGAQLEVVLPAGVVFESATNGGVHSNGVVTWALSTLQPGQSGVRRATVSLPEEVAEASILPARVRVFDTATTPNESRFASMTRVRSGSALVLALAANPDPVRPGESQDVEIVVANRGDFPVFDATVELVVPDEVDTFSEELASRAPGDVPLCQGGVSNNGACDARERLVWQLGQVAPGTGRTLRLPPSIAEGIADGSIIGWRASLDALDGAIREQAESGAASIVQSEPLLDLGVGESVDPVEAGASLTYTLSFGHLATASLAPDAQLLLELPPEASFVSATDGGVHAAGVVTWSLGTLQPGQSGERSATVEIAANTSEASALLARGRLIDASTVPNEARAEARTRVRTGSPLQLALVTNPDPVRPGETQEVSLVVSNRGAFPIFDTSVELVMPAEVDSLAEELATGMPAGGTPVCSGGVSNNGQCDPRERLTWSLGEVEAGAGYVLRLPPRIASAIAEATVVGWRAAADALDGETPEFAEAVDSALVEEAPRLDVAVTPSLEPVAPGGSLTYTIQFSNRSAFASAPGARLEFTLPDEVAFVSASGGGVRSGSIVSWWVGTLDPGEFGVRQVTVSVSGSAPDAGILETRVRIMDTASPPNESRAGAATRVRSSSPVSLQVVLPEAPVEQGQTLPVLLRITNQTAFTLFQVGVEALVPEGVASIGAGQTDGVTCSGGISNNGLCDPNERILWTIASIAPGATVELDVMFTVASGAGAPLDGEFVSLQALVSGGGEQASGFAIKPVPEPAGLVPGIAALLALLGASRIRRRLD